MISVNRDVTNSGRYGRYESQVRDYVLVNVLPNYLYLDLLIGTANIWT